MKELGPFSEVDILRDKTKTSYVLFVHVSLT